MIVHRLSIAMLLMASVMPALSGCAHTAGERFHYEEIASKNEGRNLRYGVYEPPGWDRRTPLPLVMLLHGAADDETTAGRKALTDRLDRAIAAGRLPPFLMVTLDNDGVP